MKDNRLNQLRNIFDKIDDDQRQLIDPLLAEVVFLEDKMAELKKLPFVKVHPKDPSMQKSTPAAKQYKECMQSYMNACRILLSALNKVEPSAQDDLLNLLKKYTGDYE